MGFVDIHSHILYGLDDGAKTLDDSVEMLRIAAAGGTTDIVATPHANRQYQFDPPTVEARLREMEGRSTVRVHRGCDFRLQSDTIEDALAHPTKYTINQKCYLLVEFPEMSVFSHTENVLLRLIDVGIVPIITHPERHRELPKRLADLARWIEMGCCLQITAGSVTGRFGHTAQTHARELVGHGLVHFVASDAHDTRHRPPTLDGAYREMAGEWGEDVVRPLFVDNPKAVLAGEPFDSVVKPLRRRKKHWYQFWG